jgi:hypothetical protein
MPHESRSCLRVRYEAAIAAYDRAAEEIWDRHAAAAGWNGCEYPSGPDAYWAVRRAVEAKMSRTREASELRRLGDLIEAL